MSDFALSSVIDGREIEVSETIGELTGTIRYHLHSDHANGEIAFFPSWYTNRDSLPEHFYIAAGAHDAAWGPSRQATNSESTTTTSASSTPANATNPHPPRKDIEN